MGATSVSRASRGETPHGLTQCYFAPMTVVKARIYHNPRCTKSRETLALLREHELEPEVVLYLEAPPGAKEPKA